MNIKKFSGIIFVIISLFICAVIFHMTTGTKNYYTQIDNDWVRETTPGDNLKYRYTLDAFDKKGREKGITFKTSKILREGAYIRLKFVPLRGVTSWSEVEYTGLPDKVQEQYPAS